MDKQGPCLLPVLEGVSLLCSQPALLLAASGSLRLTFRTLNCGCSLTLQLHPTQTGGAPSQGLCASLPGMPFPSPSPLYLEHPPSKPHLSLSQGASRLPEPPLSTSFPGHGSSLQARESLTHNCLKGLLKYRCQVLSLGSMGVLCTPNGEDPGLNHSLGGLPVCQVLT